MCGMSKINNLILTFPILCILALRDKRQDVVSELKRLQAETESITKIFEDEEVAEKIQTARYTQLSTLILS